MEKLINKSIFGGSKKIRKLLCLFIFLLNSTFAQINFETQFYIHHKNYYVSNLGNEDFKLVIADSLGFSLYNLDYSPYLLNVVSPIPLWVPPTYYQISYISKSLFDCDSSNIEFVITRGDRVSNFYIYRTDGALLFQRDSVTGPYNVGGLNGTLYQEAIVNTSYGTKLFLQDNNGQEYDSVYIYSLCDSLPLNMFEQNVLPNYVQIYPNPTTKCLNFNIQVPDYSQKYTLKIFTSDFKIIREIEIKEANFSLNFTQNPISSGVYIFVLESNGKIYQSGKFIINN